MKRLGSGRVGSGRVGEEEEEVTGPAVCLRRSDYEEDCHGSSFKFLISTTQRQMAARKSNIHPSGSFVIRFRESEGATRDLLNVVLVFIKSRGYSGFSISYFGTESGASDYLTEVDELQTQS